MIQPLVYRPVNTLGITAPHMSHGKARCAADSQPLPGGAAPQWPMRGAPASLTGNAFAGQHTVV